MLMGQVCREWEAAAQGLDDSTRLVLLRSGIVLDKDGGALGMYQSLLF
jgi:NAD dependent epimerase/dehydratase family enzyme